MIFFPLVWAHAKSPQMCPILCDPMEYSLSRFLCPWDSPGWDTGVGSLSLLQGDLPNPGIEPRSPALQMILYQLSHQGSPRILEWVAYPFSRGSFGPRNQSGVSCISCRFFTS